MLEFLPDRNMERVCQAIMKSIIFSRGVPDELRSDNAPELMQVIVRQVCQYLDISQIVTGGHNSRGNTICERVNQTLGAMIRKLSDLDYKDLKGFLPSFEFMINTTLSSATKCTPFEIAHVLPAQTIAQARIEAQRVGRGATDPEILEDVLPVFDGSDVKHILEKAIEIAEEVKATSEWHRRMSHESLNQKGQRYNLDHYVAGAKVYFYRLSTTEHLRCGKEDAQGEAHRPLCGTSNHRQEDRQSLVPALFCQSLHRCHAAIAERCRDDYLKERMVCFRARLSGVETSACKTSRGHEAQGWRDGHFEGLTGRQRLVVCRRDKPSVKRSLHREWFHHDGEPFSRICAGNQRRKS
jgi:hypothetical protein